MVCPASWSWEEAAVDPRAGAQCVRDISGLVMRWAAVHRLAPSSSTFAAFSAPIEPRSVASRACDLVSGLIRRRIATELPTDCLKGRVEIGA